MLETVTRVTTSAGVTSLATGLLDARRDRPWCVVSIPAETAEPLFDVAELYDEIGDICRLYVIETGDLSRELEVLLPARCQVYGGAARVYPVGFEWATAPERSPLRFWRDATATDKLVADALAMANAAGLFENVPPASVRVEGEVKTLLAGSMRAFVRLDSGDYATVLHELTFPLIPLDWVLTEGQRVTGMLDPRTRRLTLDAPRHNLTGLLTLFPAGSVTLALVLLVERQKATLAVHPSVPIEVTRRDVSSNPRDRVDLLLAGGDVVRVRVIRDEQGRTRLRLSDVDDDEIVLPALSLLEAGQPWLHPDRHVVVVEERHPDAMTGPFGEIPEAVIDPEPMADPVGLPGPGPRATMSPDRAVTTSETPAIGQRGALQTALLALDHARSKAVELERQLLHYKGAKEVAEALRLELGEMIRESNDLRDELRKLKVDQQQQRTLLRRARQEATSPGYRDRRSRFNDAESWLRHELQLSWTDRVDADDRVRWPLPHRYTFGPRFSESVVGLDDQYLAKALKASVDVLTGRVRELPARNLHALRVAEGASAADVIRADGAHCMRVYIEQSTSSARRLHYWVLPDGAIELSRVVLHDDMEP